MSTGSEQRKDTIINVLREHGPKTTRELINIIFPRVFKQAHHYAQIISALNRLKSNKLVTSKPVPYKSKKNRDRFRGTQKPKMIKLWTLKVSR